jgi:HK97 family phage prohead protease
MIEKSLPITIEKSASTEFDGSWVISSDAVDRVGDVISTTALKKLVGTEIICLWQHNADQPVGKWANLRMNGTKLVADLKLAETNLGKMIKALLDIDTPLGASVGFRGRGKPREKGGILFDAIELLETSIVSVPCNRDALQIAKSFDLEAMIEIPAPGQTDDKMRVTMEKAAAALQKSATSIHLNPWSKS